MKYNRQRKYFDRILGTILSMIESFYGVYGKKS